MLKTMTRPRILPVSIETSFRFIIRTLSAGDPVVYRPKDRTDVSDTPMYVPELPSSVSVREEKETDQLPESWLITVRLALLGLLISPTAIAGV